MPSYLYKCVCRGGIIWKITLSNARVLSVWVTYWEAKHIFETGIHYLVDDTSLSLLNTLETRRIYVNRITAKKCFFLYHVNRKLCRHTDCPDMADDKYFWRTPGIQHRFRDCLACRLATTLPDLLRSPPNSKNCNHSHITLYIKRTS